MIGSKRPEVRDLIRQRIIKDLYIKAAERIQLYPQTGILAVGEKRTVPDSFRLLGLVEYMELVQRHPPKISITSVGKPLAENYPA
ncbi:hypothetical protein [Mucilaginibacter sp. AK015]|uniref:hypothetical protein n=1 Tax=Mucilaginibacter sp. AK015 TaxID=2723072 RepID=UPI001618BB0A|nr:hypothetical protein [Mucilaginibacter sp. AK015]MBB5395184.1 hypothetical protein [Mucilaginibacter sp. AK015]